MSNSNYGLFPDHYPQTKTENKLSNVERDGLILSCLNLCRKLANDKIRSLGGARGAINADDLASEASLACVEAARYYDPARGTRFTTFATNWIQRHLSGVISRLLDTQTVGLSETYEVAASDGETVIALGGEHGFCGDTADSEITENLMKNVPAHYREIVQMVVVGGYTPEQVAAQKTLAVKDVKMILRNVAGKLTAVKESWAQPGNLYGIACEENEGLSIPCESGN